MVTLPPVYSLFEIKGISCINLNPYFCQDGTGATAASTAAASAPARAPVTATESAGSTATETSGGEINLKLGTP